MVKRIDNLIYDWQKLGIWKSATEAKKSLKYEIKNNCVDLELVSKLALNHPDYMYELNRGTDMSSPYIGPATNPYSSRPQNDYAVYFPNSNGDDWNPSVKYLIDPNSNKYEVFNSAARGTINKQIINYRNSNDPLTCASCGVQGTRFEIHHIKPFKSLIEGWIKDEGITDVSHVAIDWNVYPYFLDEYYYRSWNNYHDELAELQVLCVPCHGEITNES